MPSGPGLGLVPNNLKGAHSERGGGGSLFLYPASPFYNLLLIRKEPHKLSQLSLQTILETRPPGLALRLSNCIDLLAREKGNN